MVDQTSIAVVGVGAIGGALAAALGDSGHTVTLCDRIAFEALKRTFEDETRHYDHPVVTSPQGLGPVDWLLLCTKAHQVPGAAPWLERLIGPGTRVGVMQNGVDHEARVRTFVEADRVVPAIMLLPVAALSPGEIVQRRRGHIQVPDSPAGRALVGLFPPEGIIKVEPVADFISAAWSKLAFNAVGGAMGCLALQPLGTLGEPPVRRLAMALLEEVIAVGRAEGAVFPDDFAEQTLALFTGPFAEHWESIAVDRLEGRRMEWKARNAVVGEKGQAHGIATPLNDALTDLLALIDDRLETAGEIIPATRNPRRQ
jgi:2-dehydropantoate 2-reductase